MLRLNPFLSSFAVIYLSCFQINVDSNEHIKPLPSLSNIFPYHNNNTNNNNTILKEGLRLWCVSLKEQSIVCGDFLVKCFHCIQWTSVSHRATAAEMTHVCQTDFMSLHTIVVQRDAPDFCRYKLRNV